ncbi:uncharacterized protein LOC143430276 isoform X4 [Xylocopa sonorina]|uniref:uncharacterized protein LOC143430276 isoform X4 n=1 Tax=Xylocopa sonorina TaxID=1818115 RepID=UPI00403B18F0
MEPENSVMLESCGEDSILIQTVKNMVNETTRNELEGEEGEFFVVTDVESEQQSTMEVSNEESIVTQSDEQFSWSNLCRVCANTSDHLIPIFEGEGLQHDLCNKIHKYLPLHISENDTLPLQLCYHCAATLLAWHELLEGCLNAERRLLEMQDALQDKQASDGLETSTHDTSVSITESLQQQQETIKNEVSGELAVNDSDRCKFRVGEIDAQHEPSVSCGDKHTERRNNNLEMQVLSETDCGVNEKRETELKGDSGVVSERKYKKRAYSSKRTVEQRNELARSKVAVNGYTYYKCHDCEKILSTSYNFLIHRNTHTGEKPFTCHVCGKSFRSASGLNRHVRDVHAGIKKFACDICGRGLASKASRDEHRRTHTGERPHVCETCGKSFKQKASLHVHKSFHSKILPHECSLCDQSFKRKQELDKHIFTHTEQKPYSCDVCGKQFRSKGCISRHKRVHSNQKLYVCSICDARFSQERYLKSHRKNLHKVNSHSVA